MSEIRASQVRKCSGCGEGVAQVGPIFYRVTVETFLLEPGGIQRQMGMEQYFGPPGLRIARVFSDEVVANSLDGDDSTHFVCVSCYESKVVAELDHDLGRVGLP